MKFIVLVILLEIIVVQCKNFVDTSHAVKFRQKRNLIFHEGINWVQLIVGIGLPIELNDESITVGTVMKAFYLLPTNSSIYTHPSIDYARRKREIIGSRSTIYEIIQEFINRNGYGDGKACLLRTICEASLTPLDIRTGILTEIVHAILTPSSTEETTDNNLDKTYHAAEKLGKEVDNCAILFPECRTNFLQQFSRFLSS